jgi:hypothetical protein
VACWLLFFWGVGSGLSTNHSMHLYNVTLDERGPKAQAERRRCEVSLGGSGGMPTRKIFEVRVSEMPFPGLWGKI